MAKPGRKFSPGFCFLELVSEVGFNEVRFWRGRFGSVPMSLMTRSFSKSLMAVGFLAVSLSLASAQQEVPVFPGWEQKSTIPPEFRDPETGLRVVHLTRFPTNYGSVVYFHYNPFSPDSRLAFINAQYKDKWRHLYAFDFGTMEARPLVTDKLTQNQVVAEKSGNLYFQADHAAWVVPLAGGTPRKIADLPAKWSPGCGFTVNADETLLLGGSPDVEPDEAAKLTTTQIRNGPNVLFTIDIKSGEVKVIHRDNAWFGHVQFSPTDPDLLMFCHEGDWEKVDRIWLINPSQSKFDAEGAVTSNARIAYHRKEPREIAGHEFWHPSGKTIWFQQAYRWRPGHPFFLTSLDVESGAVTQYEIPEGFQGIHQVFSPDGSFLISDGTGEEETGPNKYLSKLTFPADGSRVLKGEHLASLQKNRYMIDGVKIEPNPHVSPDNRWVIFTATLHDTPQAYAIELPKQ